MNDALPSRKPLHIAGTESRRRPQGVRVIDISMTHDRDGFEAAMRMLREAWNNAAVIHTPAVLAFEILPDVASRERRRGPHVLITSGISIVVIHAEQEWIGGLPGQAQR